MRPCFIISGAAKRIGKATAIQLVKAGCNIVLHYHHSAQAAVEVKEQLNLISANSCALIKADLNDFATHPEIIQCALQHFGRLDGLVNNASLFYPTPLVNLNHEQAEVVPEPADLLQQLRLNWRAPLNLAYLTSQSITQETGAIVNLVDIYAQAGLTQHTIYVASKAALRASTRSLALQLAPKIRVNGVAPGAILWPEQNSTNQIEQTQQNQILDHSALKQLGTPQHIAATIEFLLLQGHYITGQTISVDGGRKDYI
ncbi:SDR family oxidoreductase [Aliikangiella sp. IMCC44632]